MGDYWPSICFLTEDHSKNKKASEKHYTSRIYIYSVDIAKKKKNKTKQTVRIRTAVRAGLLHYSSCSIELIKSQYKYNTRYNCVF